MSRTTIDFTKVNIATLTLENFLEQTGHRFRMTAEQKARNLTRETAFQEFLASLTTTNTPVVSEPSN